MPNPLYLENLWLENKISINNLTKDKAIDSMDTYR